MLNGRCFYKSAQKINNTAPHNVHRNNDETAVNGVGASHAHCLAFSGLLKSP